MRIFIAVCFTNAFKNALTETMAELRRRQVRGAYTRPENLHMTLAFIGETSRIQEIQTAAREVKVSPFVIRLGKPGHFRDILWLGIDGEKAMAELAQSVREALARHGVPFDEKPFKAHITLARKASAAEFPALEIPAAEMTVSRISVMKSERIDGKLTYTELLGG